MIVLDAGALVALERNDRVMWAHLKAAALAASDVVVPAGALAQVWRGGRGRQVMLARALAECQVVDLDEPMAKAAGVLCGMVGTSDAIDATVALVAGRPDAVAVCTSDPDDISPLLAAAGSGARLVGC